MKNINLNLMKMFFEVAKSNSFLDAANKLYISQPAISKGITKLEDDMSVKLFYRNNKGISLTPSGQLLFEYLKKINETFEICNREILAINNIETGNLVIGIQSHIVRNYFMDKIEHFRSKHPNIKIELMDMPTYQLIEKIENRKLDFVIDSSPISTIYNNIKIIPLCYLNTCFITSTENDISNIKNIKDLEKENIILPIIRSSLRKNLNKILEGNKCEIKTILEFGTEDLIIDSVRRGFGIGYVVEPGIKHLIDSNLVKKIDINCELPKTEINLVYIENNLTKVAQLFIEEELNKEIKLD